VSTRNRPAGTKSPNERFNITGCLPEFGVRCEMAAPAVSPRWGRFVEDQPAPVLGGPLAHSVFATNQLA
jgi:hypothetical protein